MSLIESSVSESEFVQKESDETSEENNMKIKSNLTRLRNRVKTLLKKPQPVQRSVEWFRNRNTLITASEVASCLTLSKRVCERYVQLYNLENFKYNDNKCANTYEKQEDYIIKKCKAFNGEKVFHDSVYTLWGKKYEQIAVNLYKKIKNTDVYDFGLLRHPYLKWLGASPDGITPDGVMLEIKCPYSRKIKNSEPPFHYYCQVQIQLEVGRLESADFMECEIKELDTLEEYLNIKNGILPKKKIKKSPKKLKINNTIDTNTIDTNIIDTNTIDTNNDNNDNNTDNTINGNNTDDNITDGNTTDSNDNINSTENTEQNGIDTESIKKIPPHGIIINLLNEPDNSEEKYIYQDNSNLLDPIDWANSQTQSLDPESYQIIYYYIPNYNILNIKRDRVWFETVKDDIKKVHDKVIFYQNNKDEFLKLLQNMNIEKNKKHIDAFNNSVCLL